MSPGNLLEIRPADLLDILVFFNTLNAVQLLVWRKFGRWQHRCTLLRRGFKVYTDAGQLVCCSCVRYKLTRTLRLNDTDGVQEIWYVAANVLNNLL